MEGWLAVDVAGLAPGETRALELAGRSVLVCNTFAVRSVGDGIEIWLDRLRSPSARCAGAD